MNDVQWTRMEKHEEETREYLVRIERRKKENHPCPSAQFPNSLSKKRSMMRIYSIRRACCSSIHRIGFVHIVQIEYEELYLRFERWSRRKGLSTYTHTHIYIYIYISHLAFKRNLPKPPPPSSITKTQQNWHASYRVTETWRENVGGGGARRVCARGEGYARTETQEEEGRGGW